MPKSRKEYFFCAILCCIYTACLFGKALWNPGWALTFHDLASFILPTRKVIIDSLLRFHELPLWNPFISGGVSMISDLSCSIFYPFNFLLLLFPEKYFLFGFNWLTALHYPLCIWGFYLFFKRLTQQAPLAFLLALSCGGAGYAVSCAYLPGILAGLLGIAWLLYFWLCYLETGAAKYLFSASLALAWPIFCDDPQPIYITALFLIPTLTFFDGGTPRSLRFRILSMLALGIATICVAAPQLLPTLEFLGDTVRDSAAGTVADSQINSLHPIRLLEYFFPLPFGASIFFENTMTPYLNGHDQTPFIFSIYPGWYFLPLLVLAASSAFAQSRKNFAWFALGILLVLLSLGKFSYLPLYSWFSEIIPLWGMFRYPERLCIYFQIAFAIFIALGLKKHKLAQYPKILWVLALVSTVEISLNFHRMIWLTPIQETLADENPFLKLLQKSGAHWNLNSIARFIDLDEGKLDWPYIQNMDPALTLPAKLSVLEWRLLGVNNSAYFGLATPLGFSTLVNKRNYALQTTLLRKRPRYFYALFGTKYFGNFHGLNGFELSEDPNSIPIFSIPNSIQLVPGDREAFSQILNDDIAEKHIGIMQAVEASVKPPLNSAALSRQANITVIERSFRKVRLAVQLPNPAQVAKAGSVWLLWNETYDKFWSAYQNNQPLPIYIANYWAMGIPIPAIANPARIELVLEYKNPLLDIGMALLLFWVLGFFYLGFIKKRRPRT